MVGAAQSHQIKMRQTFAQGAAKAAEGATEGEGAGDGGEQTYTTPQQLLMEFDSLTVAERASADAMTQAAAAMTQMAESVSMLARAATAPRRLVRDPRTGEKRSELVAPRTIN